MTKEQETQIEDIIDALVEVADDQQVPRNVKSKIEIVVKILKEDSEPSMRVNKVLHYLDEIADDGNLQPFTRTQVWNIVSMLEKI